MKGGWIGVDLDGTLAKYEKWEGEEIIGPPVELMVSLVRKFRENDYEVRILTARAVYPKACEAIIKWCVKYIGEPLPITDTKDFEMIVLFDDRAVPVVKNEGVWGSFLDLGNMFPNVFEQNGKLKQ